jgi:class 3 adenylate cyclase
MELLGRRDREAAEQRSRVVAEHRVAREHETDRVDPRLQAVGHLRCDVHAAQELTEALPAEHLPRQPGTHRFREEKGTREELRGDRCLRRHGSTVAEIV